MDKLNYDFKVKDFEATQSKHLGRIIKLKKYIKENDPTLPFDWMADNVESDIKKSNFYFYNIYQKDGWVRNLKPKSRLRMIKTLVNNTTRENISKWLEYEPLPASYDTAFYCLYYKKINRIMSSVAKLLYKETK